MKLWIRWVALVGTVLYVVSLDVCLIGRAPISPFRSYSTLILALTIQLACLVAIAMLLVSTQRFLGFLSAQLKGDSIRLFALVGPFIFLWVSAHMMALSLYNQGDNKLENSRLVDAAFDACCPSGKLLSALAEPLSNRD